MDHIGNKHNPRRAISLQCLRDTLGGGFRKRVPVCCSLNVKCPHRLRGGAGLGVPFWKTVELLGDGAFLGKGSLGDGL